MDDRVQIRELVADERHQLKAAIAAFCQMVDLLGVDVEAEDLDTPELADMLVARWRRQPKAERYTSETMSTVIGAAVGDYLRHHCRLDWRIVTDQYGTATVLHNGEGVEGREDFILAIFDSIEKRIDTVKGDFVCDFLDGLWEHVEPYARERD